MKICIVSLNFVPFVRGDTSRVFGGAEVQTAFLVDAFRRAGHDVVMVVSDFDGGDFPCAVENAFDSRAGLPGLRFFSRARGIRRALARAGADVYYQRNAGMVTGLVARFCRRAGRVFIYGAGSDVDFSPRVALTNARDRFLFRTGLRAADGVVAQNQAQRAAAEAVIRAPVEVIPNGVNVPADGAGAHSAADDGRAVEGAADRWTPPARWDGGYVAWVGALRAVKRPDLILEIARRLPHVPFVVVGGDMTGDHEIGTRTRSEARGLDNVVLTGRIPGEQVRDVLRGALCLVNTSDFEGFPNAYLEAWAAGIPVVTFRDVDGLIARYDAGVVCGSVDEMEAALAALSSDPGRAAAMGGRGRERVRSQFSPEALARRYTDFFEGRLAAIRR